MSKNEIAQKPVTKMDKFKDLINGKMKDQVAAILPKHLTPERLCKVMIVEASRTPKLLECSTISVAESIMLSAQLGLEPGGTLGHIYFIPYGNKCTPIIGYKGYLELARRSGQVARLDARVVYEGEKFEVTAGLHPNIEHSVRGDVDRSDDKIVAAYAVAVLKDGSSYFEVLWKVDIDKVRRRSKAGRSGPWVDDYSRMARKSAIRALFNGGTVPMSFELATAVSADGDDPHAKMPPIDITPIVGEDEPKEVNGMSDLGAALA
jgi:recombination protein RecT